MVKATWKGVVIAESDDTVIVDGNHYFPASAVRADVLKPSSTISTCSWKGIAAYHSLVVNGQENRDAVWHYDDPKPAAANIKGRMAFWKGVHVA